MESRTRCVKNIIGARRFFNYAKFQDQLHPTTLQSREENLNGIKKDEDEEGEVVMSSD